MSQSTTTGSNATDFQPTTQNPQGNVGGGLQPNNSNLQPISTTNGSNVFNQPGVNPQAFPRTSSLEVAGDNHTTSQAGSTPDKTNGGLGWGTLSVFFIVAALLVVGLVLLVKSARPAGTIRETKPADEPTPAMVPSLASSKPKKKSKHKKKAHKKRK